MAWSDETIQAVWEKGLRSGNDNPDDWRLDYQGNTICRWRYGDRDSDFGWEIDHIRLVSDGGSDDLSNLRPLQWRANARRQEDAASTARRMFPNSLR